MGFRDYPIFRFTATQISYNNYVDTLIIGKEIQDNIYCSLDFICW